MKRTYLLAPLLMVLFLLRVSYANPLPQPMFEVPLKIVAGADTLVLYFGIVPFTNKCFVGTDCFNNHCEALLPPGAGVPPYARFLPASSCTGTGSLCDFRPYLYRTQHDTFEVVAGFSGNMPITLSWPSGLGELFTELRMECEEGPSSDMIADSTVTISGHSEVHAHLFSKVLVVNVEEDMQDYLTGALTLFQNYPNPFNPSTSIEFCIQHGGFVSLKVYDLLGREVATLISEEMRPGRHDVSWNASDLPSGVYFYDVRAGGTTQRRKLLLLR